MLTCRICLFAPLVLAAVGAAAANPLAQPAAHMANMAGNMHGAAEICGDYTKEELEEMRREKKGGIIAMGVSEADFDAEFQKGVESGRSRLEAATPQEREESCEKLRSMEATAR